MLCSRIDCGRFAKDLVLFVIFAVSGFFREFLFCFVTVNLVRRFLGGIHMKTNIGCTVASVSVYVIAVAGGVHVIFPYPVVAGLLLFMMYLMATIAPLPSPNRPVYKGERKRRFNKRLDRTRRIEYLFGDLPCLFHIYCMDFDFTDCGGRSCSDERKLFEL